MSNPSHDKFDLVVAQNICVVKIEVLEKSTHILHGEFALLKQEMGPISGPQKGVNVLDSVFVCLASDSVHFHRDRLAKSGPNFILSLHGSTSACRKQWRIFRSLHGKQIGTKLDVLFR